MSKTVSNDRLFQAVFAATNEAKERALEILEGKEPPSESEDIALLRMGEAAQMLRVSRATLWRTIQAGRLERIELFPNSFRVRRRDVLALVNTPPDVVYQGSESFRNKKERAHV